MNNTEKMIQEIDGLPKLSMPLFPEGENIIEFIDMKLAIEIIRKHSVEDTIEQGFDAKAVFQNGRKYGFEEGFKAGRKSEGMSEIEVQFIDPPIKPTSILRHALIEAIGNREGWTGDVSALVDDLMIIIEG